MNSIYKIIQLVFVVILLKSCSILPNNKSNERELQYLQDIEEYITNLEDKDYNSPLQIGDRLVITVLADDLSVVAPFNQNYKSSETIVNQNPGGNVQNLLYTDDGPTYTIDSDGYIEFPVLGKIYVLHNSVDDIRDLLQDKLKQYIVKPIVAVSLSNFKITILGEVQRPGEYTIEDGRSTILTAIGMAGDLTIYGKREDVLLLRKINGKVMKIKINLKSSDFLTEDYMNLKQGDVIYITPNDTKEKTAKLDPNMPIYISVASIIVTILALVIK